MTAFKYKKFITLLILFILAFYFAPILNLFLNYLLNNYGIYFAIVLGFFYTFTITGGATSIMISNINENFLILAFLISIGSTIADLTILKIINVSLKDEINELFKILKSFKSFSKTFYFLGDRFRFLLSFLIIGSPLPDELGIFLLRNQKKIPIKYFILFAFLANFIFVYILARFF